MKKGLIIALCVLVALGAAAGFGYYRLNGAAQDAEQTQRSIYDQYQAMLRNAEQTTLTVTESGETIGSYTLSQLGMLDTTQQTISAGFTAEERMKPELFAQKGLTEKLRWRTLSHTQPGTVRADLTRYTDELVTDDLAAVQRKPAQDAYMDFDGEKFVVVDEVPGTQLQWEPVRAALQTAAFGLTVNANAPENATFDVTSVPDCYAAPTVTAENGSFDFNELLQEKILGVSYTIDLNLEGQTDEKKIVKLATKELSPLVSVDEDGSVKIDEEKLDVLLAGWKALAEVDNTPFILNTYVDGPKPMEFLKVDYKLDTGALKETLEAALEKLASQDIRAQMLLYKNGEPYEPLTEVYVEVDIDNQRLTVYKDGEVVTSTDVVTGNLNGYQTITGLYYAYNKETDQWMKGEDYLVFSKYWIGIDGAYGLHDASWRTHFGKDFYVNGGSHGCVNIPVDAMPEIFDTVEVGDAVILFGKNKWFEPDPETTRILQS